MEETFTPGSPAFLESQRVRALSLARKQSQKQERNTARAEGRLGYHAAALPDQQGPAAVIGGRGAYDPDGAGRSSLGGRGGAPQLGNTAPNAPGPQHGELDSDVGAPDEAAVPGTAAFAPAPFAASVAGARLAG